MLGRGLRGSFPRTCRSKLCKLSRAPSLFSVTSAQRHAHSKPVDIPESTSTDNLSEEQKGVLDRALRGENIFITGPSGSGKSHLLKIIAQQLAARKRSVLLTGGTPLSAFNIDGTLLHSFTEGQTVKQLEILQGRRRKDLASIEYRSKWQKIETLIIDDISQIDASMFDSLEKTARKSKSQKYGFGGIQIIASGDFFQLPPESIDMPAPDYAFNATKWLPTFSTNHIELSKVYSQSEPEFITMLNQARVGKLSPQSNKLLASLARPIPAPSIELCPLHVQVKALVSSHLESLRGGLVDFSAADKQVTLDNVTTSRRLNGIDKRAYDEIIPKFLGLKIGAQVMSIQDLHFGTRCIPKFTLGKITAFSTPHEAAESRIPFVGKGHKPDHPWPVIMFETKQKVLVVPTQFKLGGTNGTAYTQSSRTQLPLKLAPAGLVHEFQSSSCISGVKIDLSKRFPRGLAYSALSRARSLKGLQVLNYLPGSIVAPESVVSWYKQQPWGRFPS